MAQGANHVTPCLQPGEGVHGEAELGLGDPQGTGKNKVGSDRFDSEREYTAESPRLRPEDWLVPPRAET